MTIPYFVLWKWKQEGYRSAFDASHVNAVAYQMIKHGVPHDKIVCVTDDPSGVYCRTHPIWSDHSKLTNVSGPQLPSCYRRLKLFDPATVESMGIPLGHPVVSFDLDALIVKNFLPLFQGFDDRDFVGWRVPGHRHRIVYNGSMWMHRAGTLSWLWEGFRADRSPMEATRAGYMGSDQGYLSHQLVSLERSGGWTPGGHGVLAYVRDIVKTRVLPKTTRVIFFPGKHKPWLDHVQQQSGWIKRYWPERRVVDEFFRTAQHLEKETEAA